MGLLDNIQHGNQGGYGGLLDMLMYKSPLLQKQEQPPIDMMAGFVTPEPQSPFGPTPGTGPLPQYQPPLPPSVFNQGTSPIAGLPPAAPAAPPLPPAQEVQTAPQAPSQMAGPPQVNDMQIGGYAMPRMGSVADFTPQPGSTDISAQSRQSQMQPQMTEQQALPPALSGGGLSGIGRAFNPDGLVARLTGNDSRSMSRQNLKAQFDALVPLVGQQKAMLALLNPEAGKTIIAQALEKKQYGFIKGDNGEVIRTDPLKGTADAVYGDTAARATAIPGPDGKPIQIPQGLDAAGRKIFVNEIARINADAAAGKKTGEQATAEIFANKMELSNKTLDTLANQGTSLAGKIASGIPLGNYMQSAEYQKYKQAASNFITALLRKESGAAIAKEEWVRYDSEYMPQPGDGPELLAQKAEARRVAIEAMKKGAGPGYKSPTNQGGGFKTQTGVSWSVVQ